MGTESEAPNPLAIKHSVAGSASAAGAWHLVASNKAALNGWEALCKKLHGNSLRCYEWLRTSPMQRINGRCYPLKGAQAGGAWAYEIGSGERIYYVPDPDSRKVTVYYAGEHPPRAPAPPREVRR